VAAAFEKLFVKFGASPFLRFAEAASRQQNGFVVCEIVHSGSYGMPSSWTNPGGTLAVQADHQTNSLSPI